MDDFTTVFLFTENAAPIFTDFEKRISLGITFFLVGLIGLLLVSAALKYFKKSINTSKKNTKKAITFIKWYFIFQFGCAILWAILWLGAHVPFYLRYKNEYTRLQAEYNSKQYQVAEGIVHVTHTQPAYGHDKGDVIKIGNVELVVNAYLETFGYKATISHGGALTEGTYARVFYDYDPTASESFQYTILQVDIKK